MKISFIIPYHNEPAEMLEECVTSILSLPLKPEEREIIVVDDGSERSAVELVTCLDGQTIYLCQEHQGLSAARNNGILHSSGDYIQFVDADDALLPEYESIIGCVGCVQPDLIQFRYTRAKRGRVSKFRILSDTDGCDLLQNENLRASACCCIVRRELVADLLFLPGICHEDELFMPQLMLRARRVIVTDIEAYFYRRHEGSITTSDNPVELERRLDDTEFVISELKRLSEAPDGSGLPLKRRVSQITMDYVYRLYTEGIERNERAVRIGRLRRMGVYPLPVRCYTWKYWLFSVVSHIVG